MSELWPKNVETLRSRGVAFTWQKRGDDIRMSCAHCAGLLVMHEENPWHHCHGDFGCSARLMTFSELVAALAEKAKRAARLDAAMPLAHHSRMSIADQAEVTK